MNLAAPKTSAAWRDIWLAKLVNSCVANELKPPTTAGFVDFIGRFLELHSCHPAKIPLEAVSAFPVQNSKSEKQAKFCRDALLFFYENVAPSEDHINILRDRKIPPVIPPFDKNALIDQLTEELKVRNYSKRTVDNYCSNAAGYLAWLASVPAAGDCGKIKEYLLLLREKKYAPRTINLVAASLHFFYENVVKLPYEIKDVPRMKTGRALPKVYSQEDVGNIINVVKNNKHRLILMLAYGCGLRLSELQNLRPADFEFDRNLINIRHAKGNKDRVVMLDDVLKNDLKIFLKNGKGKTWVFEGAYPGLF
ncbi:MAG: phage integrase N-terminal SAM-like domain-containing protein [Chitinivibrionales bacterium]|nr:phage integrase N-terminal SAM-like domain-containing protein [Chitinivibrionales bacterium]